MTNKFLYILVIFFFAISCKEDKNKTVNIPVEEQEVIKTSESAILDSMINNEPNNAELYYKRANYYAKVDFVPKALVDVLTAIKIDPSKVDYYLMAGDIYINMGQGEDAVKTVEKAIQIIPGNEDLYIRNIEYQYLLKDYKKALIVVNDLLRINKNNAEAYFFKGLIFKETNNIEKSISSFQTCVEQDPTFYNAYMQLGLLFSRKNDDLAINYFDNALKIKNKSREAIYGKAYHYQQRGQYNKAIIEYKKMIENDRGDFQAFYNTAYCFLEQDSLIKAYQNFQIASSIKPDYVDAIFMLGQVNKSLGNIPDARKQYNIALKLLPENETIIKALKDIEGK